MTIAYDVPGRDSLHPRKTLLTPSLWVLRAAFVTLRFHRRIKIPLAAVAGSLRSFRELSSTGKGGYPLLRLGASPLHHPVRHRHDLVPRNRRSPFAPYSRKLFLRVFVGWTSGPWQVGACNPIGMAMASVLVILPSAEAGSEDLEELWTYQLYRSMATPIRTNVLASCDGLQICRTHPIYCPDWETPEMVDFRKYTQQSTSTHRA